MVVIVVEVQQLTADRLIRRQIVHRLTVAIRLTSGLVLGGHILVDVRRITAAATLRQRPVRVNALIVDEQTTNRTVLDQRRAVVKHLILDDRVGQILCFGQLVVCSGRGWHHLLCTSGQRCPQLVQLTFFVFDQFGLAGQRAQIGAAVVHEIELHRRLTGSNRIRFQAGCLTRKRHIVIGVHRLPVLDRIKAVTVAQQI